MEKITDLSHYRNKKVIIDEAEKLIDYIVEQAKQGTAIHKVEQDIFSKLLTMGHQALGQFMVLQGDGDMGEQVKLGSGRVVKRLPKQQNRIYRSIFGLYSIKRVVYGIREGQKVEFAPLDNRLQLPETRFSYLLQDWDQQLSVENPFNQVNKVLDRILQFKQPVDSIERMAYQGAETVEDFRNSLPKIKPDEEHDIIVATADGKGVPVITKVTEKKIETHKPKKGPKPDKKKMAIVGSAYSSAPNIRTPEEIVHSLFQNNSGSKDNKPRSTPRNKRVRVSLTRT